jgi:hypothetical protein
MPGWTIFKWIVLILLLIFVGIPLWGLAKVTGWEQDEILGWIERTFRVELP